MDYKKIRLGVCLLALCGMGPDINVRSHGKVTSTEVTLSLGGQKGEAIDRGFRSDGWQNPSKQASDSLSRVGVRASFDSGAGFSGAAQLGLGERAGKIEWSGSGNSFKSETYVSSSANDAALNRTTAILCAEYNLCIDYDPSTRPPANWLVNLAPVESGYVGAAQAGGTYYRSASAASASTPATSPASIATGDVMPVAFNLSASNGDQGSESARSGAVAQSVMTNGGSAAAMGAVTSNYQAANSRALTDSISGDDNSDQTDPLHLDGGNGAPRVTPPVIQHASQPGSNSTGNDSPSIVDSELQTAGNQVINQSTASVNWWPIGPFGSTSDVPGSNPWFLAPHDPGPGYQFSPTSTSDPAIQGPTNSGLDPASPVPEPSQLVLMFTVIGLIALAAKRSSTMRRAAMHPGV